MPKLWNAFKTTSTVCILWSGYTLARTRIWNRADSDMNNNNRLIESSHLPSFDKSSISACGESKQSKLSSNYIWSLLSIISDNSFIRQTIHTIYNLFRADNLLDECLSCSRTKNSSCLSIIANDESSNSVETNIFSTLSSQFQIIHDLACKAGLISGKCYLKPSTNGTSQFLSFKKGSQLTLDNFVQILITYCKDQTFLDLFFAHENFELIIGLLIKIALNSLSDVNDSFVNVSMNSQTKSVSTVSDLTLKNKSLPNSKSKTDMELCNQIDSTTHPEYPIHLQCATLLASLSRHPCNHRLKDMRGIDELISHWNYSTSLHLKLLSSKIVHNLSVHFLPNFSKLKCSYIPGRPVYYPDIYRLDTHCEQDDYDFDVIFVNGMLGSVFYTWRQNDCVLQSSSTESLNYTKCWPRDWLSHKFPRARIIGIDTSLKPFVWNPICPVQKFRRSLDDRATDIMEQLRLARVGSRPIIWITHSAGGILVKEMLRLAKSSNKNSSPRSSAYFNWTQQIDLKYPITDGSFSDIETKKHLSTSVADFKEFEFVNKFIQEKESVSTFQLQVISSSSSQSITPNPMSVQHFHKLDSGLCWDKFISTCISELPNYEILADQTRAIVFMSTPHRGNQSLFALYWRPFRWVLTPEAIQLERNSDYLLNLHIWFNIWAYRHAVRILTMAETRFTKVGQLWSVLLVPEDIQDLEMGEIIRIDADHLCISKPRSPNDLCYTSIVNFIKKIPITK